MTNATILLQKIYEVYFGHLYHATTIHNAIDILSENRLRASRFLWYGNVVHFTRTPIYWFSGSVRFVCNGEKLSQRYQIFPIDPIDGRPAGYSEYEVIIKKDIYPFLPYILGIEVSYLPFQKEETEQNILRLQELAGNIPLAVSPRNDVGYVKQDKKRYTFLKSL